MTHGRTAFRALIIATAIAVAAPAFAAPRLVSSMPGEKTLSATLKQVTLRFSEPVAVRQSGGELTMTSMMMDGRLMEMPMSLGALTATADPTHPDTLILTAKATLATGGYSLSWRAAGADGKTAKGKLIFNIR